MSSSGDSAACPNDSVVFTCTVDRTSPRWSAAPPPNHRIVDELSQIVTTSSGTLLPAGIEGFMFQAAAVNSSSDSLTSTLTTLTGASVSGVRLRVLVSV